ncbi:MAG: efflux transporter outer membrane subunit [Alphaproteobacteria bacterium]|nr:efflux transporter outer membrane subunit [Alphaproteobacteria bacterium]
MHVKQTLKIIGLSLILSACTVGPDFMRPDNAAHDIGTYHNNYKHIGGTENMSLWWERLGDPLLNDYADKLLRQNLSLAQAGERIIQARSAVDSAYGNFAPQIGASADAGRSFTPANGITTNVRSYDNAYSAGLSTSWEIDLFGRLQRAHEAAKANFEAAKYDYEALTHSLMADLVNRRVAIATNKALLDLAQENYINRKKIYKLVQKRYNIGAKGTTLADVYLAEENYRSVYADVYAAERSLQDALYRLDILLGEKPGTHDPLAEQAFIATPPPMDIQTCMPASLLDRRPDLKAAELRIKAANANIGVAVADLYPSFNLGGSLGYSGASTGGLFSADRLAGSLLASLTSRIFEGGKLRANIDLNESKAREAVKNYQDNILTALYEVETRLFADRELTDELSSTAQSLSALEKAEELSRERYIKGLLTLDQFLDVQQRRYASAQGYILKQQEKWQTRIALYQALGGDWFNTKNKQAACRAP